MRWTDVQRIAFKCPAKTIFQYLPGDNNCSHRFNGYGGSGYGDEVIGQWDYIFSLSVIDNPDNLATHIKDNGILIYNGNKLTDKRFACIYDGEFLAYKKVL